LYFFGIASLVVFSRRANKKYLWWKLTKSRVYIFRSLFFLWGTMLLLNEQYFRSLTKISKDNIEVMDSVFNTHLKVIEAHGIDLNKEIANNNANITMDTPQGFNLKV
jgi:hypothetical protein